MALLEAKNIRKVYATRFGGNQVQALTDVSFTVDEGEYVAIMGESGSGKTTLLMVTHSLKAASRAGRILFIRDGQVYHQLYRGEMTNEQFYEKISDALTVMTRKDAMDGEMA